MLTVNTLKKGIVTGEEREKHTRSSFFSSVLNEEEEREPPTGAPRHYQQIDELLNHRYISNELCLTQNRLYIYEYIFVYDLSLAAMFVYHFGKCALCVGGGLSPFRTTGAEREALADVEEKTDFHLNKST